MKKLESINLSKFNSLNDFELKSKHLILGGTLYNTSATPGGIATDCWDDSSNKDITTSPNQGSAADAYDKCNVRPSN